ncbi:MAG: hemerythrin domain-containing protein [Rhodospirillales bacterium]
MAALSELGQVLHEEHFRILVGICGLQNRISGADAWRPLDGTNPEDCGLLEGLLVSLDQLIVHHAFEENTVFPLIRGGGEGDLATLLWREHSVIEPRARKLRMIAQEMLGHPASAEKWAVFRDAAANLITELMWHLEKEELTVVQRLPSFLDAATDHELAVRHLSEDAPPRQEAAADRRTPVAPARLGAVHAAKSARDAAARRRSTAPARPGA